MDGNLDGNSDTSTTNLAACVCVCIMSILLRLTSLLSYI